MKGSNNRIRGAFLGLTTALMIAAALPAAAQIINLTDGNSSVAISSATQAGMYNWSVEGQNQLFQQWFWYRLDSGPQASIDTIGAPVISHPDAQDATTLYAAPSFTVQVSYHLGGGAIGSGVSGMNESIVISNRTGAALDLHFFQYADFDLGASLSGDTVQLGKDIHGFYNYALQIKDSRILQESDIVPSASHGEANLYANTLNSLNSGVAYTLNDAAGPISGDATWAFEWDYSATGIGTIQPFQTAVISKSLSIQIPEPSTFAMVGLGLLVCGLRLRRARR